MRCACEIGCRGIVDAGFTYLAAGGPSAHHLEVLHKNTHNYLRLSLYPPVNPLLPDLPPDDATSTFNPALGKRTLGLNLQNQGCMLDSALTGKPIFGRFYFPHSFGLTKNESATKISRTVSDIVFPTTFPLARLAITGLDSRDSE